MARFVCSMVLIVSLTAANALDAMTILSSGIKLMSGSSAPVEELLTSVISELSDGDNLKDAIDGVIGVKDEMKPVKTDEFIDQLKSLAAGGFSSVEELLAGDIPEAIVSTLQEFIEKKSAMKSDQIGVPEVDPMAHDL